MELDNPPIGYLFSNPRFKQEKDMRIKKHPILEFKHTRLVPFTFDGKTLYGYEGEPIIAALHDNGVRVLRTSLKLNRPRGLFCAIGHCASCFMIVNGKPNTRVCIEPLREGDVIETQHGKGEFK